MVKILSKSGDSLADTYDVVGSVAGIEQLESREVTLVHEMGGTLFSERFSTFIRKVSAVGVAQSTTFDEVLDDLPAHPMRIFGIQVLITVTARVALASVALRDADNGREIPIWAWDDATDSELAVRWSDDGGAVATRQFLQPAQANVRLPHMVAGSGQPQFVSEIALRGLTSAFGAGTVTIVLLLHIGFSRVAGLSSRGLPIPSW